MDTDLWHLDIDPTLHEARSRACRHCGDRVIMPVDVRATNTAEERAFNDVSAVMHNGAHGDAVITSNLDARVDGGVEELEVVEEVVQAHAPPLVPSGLVGRKAIGRGTRIRCRPARTGSALVREHVR
jgi:hypothetical protein